MYVDHDFTRKHTQIQHTFQAAKDRGALLRKLEAQAWVGGYAPLESLRRVWADQRNAVWTTPEEYLWT